MARAQFPATKEAEFLATERIIVRSDGAVAQ